ncbi:MAG TPA: Gfo/Idh/MocA family oxidoreductase [Bryobacteraceae bacterium]|nr:Gfo/Idh/MocA family oxidoreductase [Bryobacteraceae bacterium]
MRVMDRQNGVSSVRCLSAAGEVNKGQSNMDEVNRRSLLKIVGSAGLMPAFAEAEMELTTPNGPLIYQVAEPGEQAQPSKESIKFAVIGLDHNHILAITAAVQRGGGQLVSFYSNNPRGIADFKKRFGEAKLARGEEEILNDKSIQLVASASIPVERAPLGIRVMRAGKDFLVDKPGITTLEQLAEVRKTIQQTGRIYAIMYSERLEVKAAVKAGDLVKAGAIGRVIQTVNLAPHQINQPNSPPRPEWFWDPARYGGILCDIGSHQADQFVYYTGSTTAEVTGSQIANVNHADKPNFQDFGDMMVHGNGGAGYVRVDWFTPNGLGVWGDGRLFILGTEGYIELRKYADVAGRKGGNHLFIVDRTQARYIDCNNVELPFGPQFVRDIINRTHIAQDQEQALLATELVLKAQKNAKWLHFSEHTAPLTANS